MEKKELRAAIVGLGRVGSTFLSKLTEKQGQGIKVVVAAETKQDSPGIQTAKENGIRVVSDGKEIIEMGDAIDIIFDLTGNRHAKMELRVKLAKSGNMSTVIAPEVLAFFIWNLIAEGEQFPVGPSNP
jgi:aspartate-semialdehyde dehydrogenase